MAATMGSTLEAQRLMLQAGLPLLHSYAGANPSVFVRVVIRGGASRERGEDQGLASLTGRMLRQGTHNIGKAALAEELDGMGAGLSVDVGYALTSMSIKCLSSDFPRAMQILAEVLRRPTMPAQELERLRGQVLTDLREMEDNTRVVAERLWRSLAYPADHRFHRLVSGTVETVSRFTRDDLAAFHEHWYGPNQATVFVVGDVSQESARTTCEEVFGGWAAVDPEPFQATLPDTPDPARTSQSAAMVGKTQADVVIGRPALNRTSPDYYALAFANHILGRMYFMGRFGEKVRDEQGLAYYAYSELAAGWGRGPWMARAGVNPANLEKALASIDAELRRFLDEGPTEAEQADGVSSLLGSLPRQLESNEGVSAVLSEIEMYGLGLDYLDRYPDLIRSLSREQVTDVARRYLAPEGLVTAIAGPAV